MAFTSSDDIIRRITQLGNVDEYWFSSTNFAQGPQGFAWNSTRNAFAVGHPVAGPLPTSTPTSYSSDVNCITFPNVSPSSRYLVGMEVVEGCARPDVYNPVPAMVMLYDRLTATGAITLASTGDKAVTTPVLPRYSGTAAANVQCWIQVHLGTATTAAVVNLSSYTADDGTTASVGGSVTFPFAAVLANALIGPMPLAAKDRGLRSVETGLHISTASAQGTCSVVLLRPLATVSIVGLAGGGGFASCAGWVDPGSSMEGFPQIFDGASLEIAYLDGTNLGYAIQCWQGCVRTAYTP